MSLEDDKVVTVDDPEPSEKPAKNSKAQDVVMDSQESEPVRKLVRNRNRKKATVESDLVEEEQLKARPQAPIDDALDVSEEDGVEEIEDLCSQQAIKAKSLAQRQSSGELN